MKIDVEKSTIETCDALPWRIILLLFLDVVGAIGIAVVLALKRIDLQGGIIALAVTITILAVLGIILERQIKFSSEAYAECLRLQKARTDAETQNSKLSETLLKIWEHREKCKDKSVKVTMEVGPTSLSC